jgi:glycosyltransferase involved in cell wall biosynthesis
VKNYIILFDQDTQHYRQSIYFKFKEEFLNIGYHLIVVYDNKLNSISDNSNLFIGINFTLLNFIKIINKYKCKRVIQFVWLRYKFIIPVMIINRIRNIKTIVWSHGINLQIKNQPLKNQLYFLRQKLANALIIYTPEQNIYIKANKSKVFVANNTLNFESLPVIVSNKEELKKKYNLTGEKVVLCVGRMNTNNRKVSHLIELSGIIEEGYRIIIIGPGVNKVDQDKINLLNNIEYKGSVYDQQTLCEYYKLSDLFVMPGAIGLAINQSFYYKSPVIVENVDQGPEAFYLINGINGFYYKKNDIHDLKNKIDLILNDNAYSLFSKRAYDTILKEASFENMLNGFINAISFLDDNEK